MPKPSPVEVILDRLAALRNDPAAPGAAEEISRALASRVNFVAAKAAAVAVELRLSQLAPHLIESFTRFANDSISPDKGCVAKTALADALLELDPAADGAVAQVFLPGVRLVQMEPRWDKPGEPDDVAAALRGACALGLVAAGYGGAMVVLTDLLTDRWPAARAGAARALGHTGQDAAALLLRLKLVLADGDPDPDVAAECMNALVKLWPAKSLPFVASYLSHAADGTREAAAFALGASRQLAALDALRTAVEKARDPDARRTLLLAVATLRLPESLQYLLTLAASPKLEVAAAAVEALSLYRHDPAVREKLAALFAGRDDAAARAFGQKFTA